MRFTKVNVKKVYKHYATQTYKPHLSHFLLTA